MSIVLNGFSQQNFANRSLGVLRLLSVLNTPPTSGSRTRQTCGFFTSIDYGRVACIPKNSRKAKVTGRLVAVFKYLTAPLNKGKLNNLQGHIS